MPPPQKGRGGENTGCDQQPTMKYLRRAFPLLTDDIA
jgi:hypothetical protein